MISRALLDKSGLELFKIGGLKFSTYQSLMSEVAGHEDADYSGSLDSPAL